MAQTDDFDFANQSGLLFRQQVNAVVAALVSSNSGSTAPDPTFPGMFWLDTSTTPAALKQRNAADDAWLSVLSHVGVTATAAQINKSSTIADNAPGSAPIYACRAWVNFNGTGTVAIRASGNVSSITDNGTGRYTINLTTSMTDANYAIVGAARSEHSGGFPNTVLSHDNNQTQTTTSCLVQLREGSFATDSEFVYVAIFR
jgi:hypothetical protein